MLKAEGVQNLVVLTGDLHSYLASYLKLDYTDPSNTDLANLVGVEFMTPAVTSANFKERIEDPGRYDDPEARAVQAFGSYNLIGLLARLTNPHLQYFNSEYWGYSIVEFNRSYCEYEAYRVDKSINSPDVPKHLLRRYRVPVNEIVIERM